jgi:hypothetical protein
VQRRNGSLLTSATCLVCAKRSQRCVPLTTPQSGLPGPITSSFIARGHAHGRENSGELERLRRELREVRAQLDQALAVLDAERQKYVSSIMCGFLYLGTVSLSLWAGST